MSNRVRVLIPTIAVLSLIISSNYSANAQETELTKPKNASTSELARPLALEKSLSRIASALEAGQQDPSVLRAERRAESDLQAQQDMARWAKWMFFATTATVILTGLGAALLWRTLIHTRRASKYAGVAARQARTSTHAAIRSAEAGRDANKLTEHALVITERARIFFVSNNTMQIINPAVGVTGYVISARWQNGGRTEAENVQMFWRVAVRDTALSRPLNFDFPERGSAGTFRMGPGAEQHTDDGPNAIISIETLKLVFAGERRLFFWSGVAYDDIFQGNYEGSHRHYAYDCREVKVVADPTTITLAGSAGAVIVQSYDDFSLDPATYPA